MSTLQEKLTISAGSAALFALANLPQTFKLTSSITGLPLWNNTINCPTNLGLLVHALIFFVVTFLTMSNANISTKTKLKHSLYGTLLFFAISNPVMFHLTENLFGKHIATGGCPTLTGIILHTFVYWLSLVGIMYL